MGWTSRLLLAALIGLLVVPWPNVAGAQIAPDPAGDAGSSFSPGLVIFKHRADAYFDFEDFVDHPARYIEGFEALTRAEDHDDWTALSREGTLRTHFGAEDLFLVRTEGDFALGMRFGDLSLEEYLTAVLEVQPGSNGCYSTLHSGLRNEDGTPVRVPHRLLFCPELQLALFDAPDGYEIELHALAAGELNEVTRIGTSIADNVRLYVSEVHPRHPSARATGRIPGNITAGYADAGAAVLDSLRHLLSGVEERHLHTGHTSYRPSPISAVPRAVAQLLRGHPLRAFGELVAGAESGVQAGADLAAAADALLANPLIQVGVGLAFSPAQADRVGDYVGAVVQAAIKNLPLGERSNGVLDLRTSWRHARAWEPARYTRTDTQLNIDRVFTLLDFGGIHAARAANDGGCTRSCRPVEPLPLPGDGTPETPLGLADFLFF